MTARAPRGSAGGCFIAPSTFHSCISSVRRKYWFCAHGLAIPAFNFGNRDGETGCIGSGNIVGPTESWTPNCFSAEEHFAIRSLHARAMYSIAPATAIAPVQRAAVPGRSSIATSSQDLAAVPHVPFKNALLLQ